MKSPTRGATGPSAASGTGSTARDSLGTRCAMLCAGQAPCSTQTVRVHAPCMLACTRTRACACACTCVHARVPCCY